MSERVYVQVDDAELTVLTSRLDDAMSRLRRIDVDTVKLDARSKAILTRLPGLREADMLWREIEAMSTIAAGAAGVVGIGASLFMLASALKTVERRIAQIERGIIRGRAGLEDMVREGMDLTHEEYLALGAEQLGYATAFDEFKAKWDAGEHLDAIADYVIALIPSRIPTFAGRIPYDPATIPPEIEEHWLKKLDDALLQMWNNIFGKYEDTGYEYDMNLHSEGGGGRE